MLWPWVYIIEENSNKIYVKKHLEEVLYSNRKKNRITHIRKCERISTCLVTNCCTERSGIQQYRYG